MQIRITDKKGAPIPKEFIGLFIEDINYAIDGGLYAEMLENRSFESLNVYGGENQDYVVEYDGLYAWKPYKDDKNINLKTVQGSPVHENNPHYLRVTSAIKDAGFVNKAYDGLTMSMERYYKVTFYARPVTYEGNLRVAIVQGEKIITEQYISVKEGHCWNQYQLELHVDQEVSGGEFVIFMEETGIIEFDFFSMLPDDAVFGIFRKDLADLLKELHPGFLRFPGGCVVEGAVLSNRYQFKNTLGELESRKYNWNRWALHMADKSNGYHSPYAHYGQTYGIGFYEYFLLCEYIGAKPLPVLGVGLACQFQSEERIEPDDPHIREYIQEYLSLIEFANGSIETYWGALREKMGHESPFHLEMIGVGNEQWEDEKSRFFERYELFEKEIHKVYPDIRLIGTAGPELDSPRFYQAWDFYKKHQGQKNFVYAVDEHYYAKPEWFMQHVDYYDHVPRDIKIFLGEYAAHPYGWMPMNSPQGNNLEGALAEAAFLTGAARNSDVVIMTCYAPLLARIGYAQWNPDLIWFDGKKAYKTPNYYVQQMFAENSGDYNICFEKTGLPCQVSYDEKESALIIKLINTEDHAQKIQIELDSSWTVLSKSSQELLLKGDNLSDTNSIEKEIVRPVVRKCEIQDKIYDIPPYSFSILRIQAEKRLSCN